jgi:hypothetical protein
MSAAVAAPAVAPCRMLAGLPGSQLPENREGSAPRLLRRWAVARRGVRSADVAHGSSPPQVMGQFLPTGAGQLQAVQGLR